MSAWQAMPTSLNDSVEWTTNAGTPVVDNDHSLTVGQRGPVLLEDYHLLEKLAQFDRERIPERVVHARGMSAKGYFEVRAVLRQGLGKKSNAPWTLVSRRFHDVFMLDTRYG